MNRSILMGVVAAIATGCVVSSTDSPIRVTELHVPGTLDDGSCVVDPGERLISRGSVNVGGPGINYLLQVDVSNQFDPETDQVGDDVLAGDERLAFYIDSVTFTYQDEATLGQFIAPQTIRAYGYMPVNGGLRIIENLVATPAVATAIANALTTAPSLSLLVGIQYAGHTMGGVNQRSTPVVFPVTFDAGAALTCPATGDAAVNTRPVRNGPCGTVGGQDGIPFRCECPPPATDPACNKSN